MTFGLVSGMLPWEVPWDVIASFQDMFFWMQGLEYVDVPQQYMEDLLAEDTACGMAELAKQARRENDPGTAQMYEEQANVHWLRHHAHVMLYPAHMRPALMPFPFPNQRPGPPLAYQADPNLPAWGSPAARSAAPGPAQATAPQGQDPAQPQGQDPAQPQGQHPEEPQGQALVLQSLMQPQPVQVQAQAQPQALHMDTAPVAQAVQPEAQVGTVILETACTNDSTCRCDLAGNRDLAVMTT